MDAKKLAHRWPAYRFIPPQAFHRKSSSFVGAVRICKLVPMGAPAMSVEVVLMYEGAITVSARKRPLARVAAQVAHYVCPAFGLVVALAALVNTQFTLPRDTH